MALPGTCGRGHQGTAVPPCCHPSPGSALPETSWQDQAGRMLPRFVSRQRHRSVMPQTGQPLPDSPSAEAGRGRGGGQQRGLEHPYSLCSCPAALCQDQAGWRWASVTHYPCSHPDDTFIASRTGLLPARQPHGSEAGKRAGSARARRGWRGALQQRQHPPLLQHPSCPSHRAGSAGAMATNAFKTFFIK